MQLNKAVASASRCRWWLALLAVVVIGYAVGKDLAMRDNGADALAREGR